MASLGSLPPPLDPLTELQRGFCIAKMGGDLFVIDRDEVSAVLAGTSSQEVSYYRSSAANRLLGRCLENLPVASRPAPVIAAFWVNPATLVYDATAFSPVPQPATTLNYWVGSTVDPVAGDWSLVSDFLRDIICAGEPAAYEYLLNYLAHALQRPEDKPGVMIVLIGGQGTGKGSFFRLLSALWPRTTLQVSAAEHVVGGFNAALERNYLVLMDEAFFAGDKKSSDRLKSMITEPTITVEQKHQPRRTLASFHRFFAATNHNHFGQVDADDRRHVVLRVSDDRKGNPDYWDGLYAALDDSAVIAAVADFLTHRDISGFKVRARPQTAALMGQKLRSLSGFSRYWREVLQTGGFHPASPGGPFDPWKDERFIPTSTLGTGYNDYSRPLRRFESGQQSEIHDGIAKLCPSATRDRQLHRGCQSRGYVLPPLPAARAEFEQFMGGPIDWEAL